MSRSNKWTTENIPDLHGKNVIITGANSGTGYEATKILTEKGAYVIMACRSETRGKESLEKILKNNPKALIEYLQLDLSSLMSIKEFVRNYKSKHDRLDILLNNAGVMQTPQRKTADDFELQIGTNHLGHFALTGLLFELIKNTSGSRIVTMSSMAHTMGSVNTEDLNFEKSRKYDRSRAYAQSKLANLLFAYELDRKLEKNNISVISLGAHPGYSATKLQSAGLKLEGGLRARLWRVVYGITNRLVAQSAYMGTLPMIMAATLNDVNGGDYFGPKGFRGMRGQPGKVTSNGKSHDTDMAQKLWNQSEELTGIKYNFN
ncbi:MAG: Sulfoacetaldehyde reductase [Candidatus Heimdallarchaeota archaeon LC_3]|nr:MAG: Sulfoacetaldehyde reductase [Candidatus Heimdallarchaeota archaeon LC_3]